jgi:hypothetical protein
MFNIDQNNFLKVSSAHRKSMSESQCKHFIFAFEDVYFLILYICGHVNSFDTVCGNSVETVDCSCSSRVVWNMKM